MEGRNKRTIIIALAVAVVVLVAGVMLAMSPKDGDQVRLRIGVLPVIDTLPLYVADDLGLFEEQGLDVELVEFNSALERDTAFTVGSIDGYFGDLINTLIIKKTLDVKVVTVDYHTVSDHRMFAILASPNSGISELSQINGSAIATSVASISEYFLDEMLAVGGVVEGAQKTEIPAIPIRYSSLLADQVQLAVLPEPFVTRAISEGAMLLTDDRSINTTATVIALRGDIVTNDPDTAQRFLEAYNASVSRVNEDPWVFNGTLRERIHFPQELIGAFDFPPLSSIQLPSEEDLQRVQGWMTDIGMLNDLFSYDDVMAVGLYG